MENDTGSLASTTQTTLVSDTELFYIESIVSGVVAGLVSIFGIVTNIINIVVFLRQGVFGDSGSVSLLGLAVADLLSVIFMLWMSVTKSLVLAQPSGLPWSPWDLWYITGGWPHLMFAQTARMVTAYIAFERCVCVVLPFKVKTLLTPRRSALIIVGVFVTCGVTHTPVFVEQNLQFRRDPDTNTTRLVLASSPTWQRTVDIMWYVNSISFNLGSVAVVLICTLITASRVKLSKSWRESMAAAGSSSSKPEVPQATANKTDRDAPSSIDYKDHHNSVIASKQKDTAQSNKISKSRLQKEKKLVRMITAISVLFLLSFTPDLTFLLMYTTHPDIRLGRREQNLAVTMYAFTFLMETANSSINIIVYYRMSSRYKQELDLLFGWGKKP